MRDRIFKAFDGVNLSETKSKMVLNNVLEGSVGESNMKKFWQGKIGGAVVIAVAALIFVTVNVVLLGGNGDKTPLSNSGGDVLVDVETTAQPTIEQPTTAQLIAETTFEPTTVAVENETTTGICAYPPESAAHKDIAYKIISFVDENKVIKIHMSDGQSEYSLSSFGISGEGFDDLLIGEKNGKTDEFNPGHQPNVYGAATPMYSVTFYHNNGNDQIVDKYGVQSEADILFDELNIYSESEISINGVYYNANAASFIATLEDIKARELSMSMPKEVYDVIKVDSMMVSLPVKNGQITTEFGVKYNVMHYGTDFAPNDDKNVYAVSAGTVIMSKYDAQNGNTVKIDHGNGVVSEYGCLESMSVSVGTAVNAGDVIGIMGKTGYATGVHLCWKMCVDGEYVDPMSLLNR